MADLLSRLPAFAALAGALALAACSPTGNDSSNLANLDNQLVGNDADPALTSALQDQIAVDRNLSQQSNRNAVRPPATPAQAQYPAAQQGGAQASGQGAQAGSTRAAGGGAAAASPDRQHAQLASVARGEGGAACGTNVKFDYNNGWANRLPQAFPVYPGGRVTEAAGNNQGDCRVRVVTFTTGDHYQRVLDWYHSRAVRSGYNSEHQLRESDHILAGANNSNGGAFYLIVTPGQRGAQVALIANNGR